MIILKYIGNGLSMNKTIFLIWTISFIFICGCSQKKIQEYTFDPEKPNLEFLKKLTDGRKIIAIGESSRTHGDLMALKTKMIQYLHEKLGYDLLIMEAGYGDVGISYFNVDESTAKQLRNSTVIPLMQSEQIAPLFDYIKKTSNSENPLILAGNDPQRSGLAFEYRLMKLIMHLEPRIIQDSIKNGLKYYNKMYQDREDYTSWTSDKTYYISGIDLAEKILKERKEEILDRSLVKEEELEMLLTTLDMLRKGVDFEFGQTFTRGLAIRDSLMAHMTIKLLEQKYPEKKAIIWGHNGHIENGIDGGSKIHWMGHILKNHFGDDYFSIGMFVKKGEYLEQKSGKARRFDITEEGFLEKYIYDAIGKNVIISLPDFDPKSKEWPHKKFKSFEPEAGGVVEFTPAIRFDAVGLLETSSIPTYKR